MSRYGSGDVGFVLIGGYNILSTTTDLEMTVEDVTEETTALGDTWQEHDRVGVRRGEFSLNGFYDDAANAANEALVDLTRSAQVAAVALEGNTIGKQMTGFAGTLEGKYIRQASRGALHKANATYAVSGAVEEGIILHELSAETADGDTEADGYDGTAQSTDGGAGYLQVTALDLDGYDDVTFKVRDSADDVTYADLLSFTAVTAAPDAERVAVTGTVERYLASSWEFGGTGTSPSVTFMAAFARY